MLSEVQKNRFDARAKEVAKNLLNKLDIAKLNDDNICQLQEELDFLVSSLVNAEEAGDAIDEKLLDIYDLLVDIVLDNEDDTEFLNQLFLG